MAIKERPFPPMGSQGDPKDIGMEGWEMRMFEEKGEARARRSDVRQKMLSEGIQDRKHAEF